MGVPLNGQESAQRTSEAPDLPAFGGKRNVQQGLSLDGAIASDSGVISSVIRLLPIYVVYVFLAGWTFYDYYFRHFGVNPRSLDIAFHDT